MQLLRGFLAVSSLLVLAGPASAANTPGVDRLLNNEGLVVMARAGYNEKFLLELIQSQPGRFDTSVEGLVYLAKKGISEKIVRVVMAAQRDAERADSDEPVKAVAKAPVRMKVVMQKVLVPVAAMEQPLGAHPVILVEKRVFGDRYYAMPGAQAPITTPVATPRAPQTMPAAATQVAAFR